MPEALSHTTLPWMPADRARYALVMRYHSQHLGGVCPSHHPAVAVAQSRCPVPVVA